MIKELPIIDNPWIQTYQIRNFELGILQNQVPWIYGKYINCCCHKKSFTHCIGSHGRFFTKDNAMLMQKFKFDKSIFENSNWNFVEFVKNMIDHQWYVLGDFDEYYIRVKDAYKNCHFRHWAFIYGYDDIAETFLTIGYTRGGKYRKYVMSFEEYNNAIKVAFDQESDKYVKKHIDRIEFYAVKINPQYSFQLNLNDIYIGISDYLQSRDSYDNNEEDFYGIDCERKFSEYLLNIPKDDKIIDIRFSRLFMELKNIMLHRLKYLSSTSIISEDLVLQYETIANKQNVVHMLCIKYNITHNEQLLNNISDILSEVICLEQKILPKVNENIYKVLKSDNQRKYC